MDQTYRLLNIHHFTMFLMPFSELKTDANPHCLSFSIEEKECSMSPESSAACFSSTRLFENRIKISAKLFTEMALPQPIL
jgi:hypothetical protein